jgi:hypothetical protein
VSADSDPAASAPARRSRASALLRGTFEFALLFGLAMLVRQVLIATGTIGYPNPLWLPVIVLSLQHGMATGLAAALLAAGLQVAEGLPPPLMTEDMYGYIGRIAAEPIGWTCVALLIGHIRSRQITEHADLERERAEHNRHADAVAALCTELRGRLEMLERQIAAESRAPSIEVAEATVAVSRASWDDLALRLTRFVLLVTGAAEFSVYLLRNGALELVFQPDDQHLHALDKQVRPDDPLFAAVVGERRSLRAPADAPLLGSRGTLAAPLLEGDAPDRVTGMLTLGGSAAEDLPADIDRRLALACREIARLAGRIGLIESWHAAATPVHANGHGAQAAEAATHVLQSARAQPRQPLLPDNELSLP